MFPFEKNSHFAEKYTLIERIGVGGFAEVWKVERSSNFIQAIKIFTNLNQEGEQIARQEFETVFNLNHPRLLKAVDYGVYEGYPYLVMPYCENGNVLSEIGRLEEPILLKMLLDISGALTYLHGLRNPLLHHDIKPDNFLIDNEGNYMLADFGISQQLRRNFTKSVVNHRKTKQFNQTSKVSGFTPLAYRPPEMFEKEFDKRQLIKASDIWSLGATFFELATGECPFREYGGLLQFQGQDIPDLPSDKFSVGFQNLLKRCLDVKTWNRPTAAQIESEIINFLNTGKWLHQDNGIEETIEMGVISGRAKKSKIKQWWIGIPILVIIGVGLLTSNHHLFMFEHKLGKVLETKQTNVKIIPIVIDSAIIPKEIERPRESQVISPVFSEKDSVSKVISFESEKEKFTPKGYVEVVTSPKKEIEKIYRAPKNDFQKKKKLLTEKELLIQLKVEIDIARRKKNYNRALALIEASELKDQDCCSYDLFMLKMKIEKKQSEL